MLSVAVLKRLTRFLASCLKRSRFSRFQPRFSRWTNRGRNKRLEAALIMAFAAKSSRTWRLLAPQERFGLDRLDQWKIWFCCCVLFGLFEIDLYTNRIKVKLKRIFQTKITTGPEWTSSILEMPANICPHYISHLFSLHNPQ